MRLIKYKATAFLVVLCTFFGIYCSVFRLHDAAKAGNLEKVKELIEKKTIKVDRRDIKRKTPLIYAVEYGHKDVVEYLISKGADVNKKSGRSANENTALHYAAGEGDSDILRFLIEKGADVDKTNKSKRTPLYYAVKHIRYDNVVDLLEKGAPKTKKAIGKAKEVVDKLKKEKDFVKAMRSLDLGDERRDEDKTRADAEWIYSKLKS